MGTKYDLDKIPVSHRRDIEKAVRILEDAGCEEVYLFGSIADGSVTPRSDIDIAARLMMQLDHPVDLVSLEEGDRFARMLQEEGRLRRVI
jgi:predicted nucleotidyltransferase